MNFISGRKFKFYTKETLKFLNITLLALGFISAIILIKYKPMYEVNISGEKIGFVESKAILQEVIKNDIENYKGQSIDKVELKETPEYQFKLVEKTQESNKDDILIALQKDVEITYKYYEIAAGTETVENVNSLEEAEQISNEIKELTKDEIILEITEKTTTDITEVSTNELEIAKANVIDKLEIDKIEAIANINGIKIATLPITGIISSRYGANSSIRSSRHTGLDIAAKIGTPIKVVADGTVAFAQNSGSYGKLVKVDHGNGVETWYAHTSKMYVKAGQEVKAGDIIADVGNTGNSTGAHLHLEVRIDGQHINPQKYLYK